MSDVIFVITVSTIIISIFEFIDGCFIYIQRKKYQRIAQQERIRRKCWDFFYKITDEQ